MTAVNYEPTPDVRAFAAAIRRAGRRAQKAVEAKEKAAAATGGGGRAAKGAGGAGAGSEDPTRVPISFFTLDDRFRTRTGVATVDASTLSASGWFGAPLLWARCDAGGFWTAEADWPCATEEADMEEPAGKEELKQEEEEQGEGGGGEEEEEEEDVPPSSLQQQQLKRSASSSTALAAAAAARDAAVRSALALVEVEIPVNALVDGVHARRFAGTAVVVHQSRSLGLALVDRNTAPVASADARLSFGGAPADAAARPAFLHPLHNFALLSYDPRDLEAQGVDISAGRGGEGEEKKDSSPSFCGAVAAVALDEAPLAPADRLHLCGLSKDGRLVKRDVVVINPNAALQVRRADVPRFRAVHEEVVRLDHDYGAFSGVLVRSSSSSAATAASAAGEPGAAAAAPSSSSSSDLSSPPKICGVWASYSEQVDRDEREFCAGLPAATFARWVAAVAEALDGGVPPSLSSSPSSLEDKAAALSLSGSGGSASSSPSVGISVPVLDAELEPLPLVKAAAHGLPRAWVVRLAAADADDRRQALRVKVAAVSSSSSSSGSVEGSAAAAAALKSGDLVLAINGQVVTSFAGVEDAVWKAATAAKKKGNNGTSAAAPASEASPPPTLHLTVCRAGVVLPDLAVPLGFEDGLGTRRVLLWCGAQLQAPHRGVRELGFALPTAADGVAASASAAAASSSPSSGGLPSGVYVSRWHHGSPAHRYGLYALNFIVAVGGVPTPDLDAFAAAVRDLPDGAPVRVALVHLETTKPKVLTLKQDLRYWPTTELVLEGGGPGLGKGWERRVISSVEGGAGGDGSTKVRRSKR